MKEILKYLRQLNSFSQEEIAFRLGISRQSYIKYEKGFVVPSEQVVAHLAKIYGVTTGYIEENKVPVPEVKKPATYTFREERDFSAAEPKVQYGTSPRKFYDGVFDGNVIQIINSSEKKQLKEGQRIKFYIEDEKEDLERRKKALETIMDIVSRSKPVKFDDDDPYYKKALMEALDEKYGLN